uniref:Putative pilus adhesin n=1 Tax=Haemophilus influenzae biotype aegyptius TaxID=725 RepID=O68264_HAEIF|nr:putative pilus adhesin [Haemophilus influenzae biotype aegyptius]
MKTLKSSPLPISLLPYLMVLLFLFSAYPAMAAPKQAQGADQIYGTTKYFTFTGSTDLVASSTQPSIIFFSRVRDNPKNNTFYSNGSGGSISSVTSLTNWINTNITGVSGYSFRGFTCSGCTPLTLPLNFYLNTAKLENTSMKDPNTGDSIFKIKDHPELGVSFQLGMQHQSNSTYLSALNFDNAGVAHIGGIQLYFGDSVSIVFLLRARLHLLGNPSNKIIPKIDLNLGYIKLSPINYKPRYITFVIKDDGQINVHLKTPQAQLFEKIRQCFLVSSETNKTVRLKQVKKREFDNINEIEGGEFKLSVSCNRQENQINDQWLFPRVMITFKGENDTVNDGSSNLLKTQQGSGQATGVSLRIKRQDGRETVKYGADSAQMGNLGQFALQKQPSEGDKNAQETFKVYYVKDLTKGNLTEGKVKAAATFTMSYQ